MASNTMRQLEERHVAIKVELMVWSNKLDLLALSNVRGEVALHRLSWQKVWSLPPPSEGVSVKGMAWRPDGKVIAIAYSTSEVLLVDVENKEVLHTTRVEGEITLVSWVQEKDMAGTSGPKYCNQDTASTYLPKLPSLSRSFGSGREENLEDAKKIRDQTLLNILLIGLANGRLLLSVFGLFPCGTAELGEARGRVLGVQVSESLNWLLVTLAAGEELTVVQLDTSVLAQHCQELHALALKHGQLVSLLSYLSQTMNSITEAWENILLEMDSKLSKYAAKVPEGSVSADFLDLLMFGTASPELEMFLLQDLTDKGLKKLGHSIELSYSNIQKLVLKHLQSAGHAIAYHLQELRGMARLPDRYVPLGLNEESINNALSAVGGFLVKTMEVQQVINSSMKNYKVFFRWLYVTILRFTDERAPSELIKMTQQELAYIAEFLYSFDGVVTKESMATPTGDSYKPRFNLERLGQYLVDHDLVLPPDTCSNPWEKFLEENPLVGKNECIIPHDTEKSLVQQLNMLHTAIEEVFHGPEACIGQLYTITEVMTLSTISTVTHLRTTHVALPKQNKVLLSFLDPGVPQGFYFIEIPVNNGLESVSGATSAAYFYFDSKSTKVEEVLGSTGELKILDVQFYLPEWLSILLEQGGENRATVFLQFSMHVAREHCVVTPWVESFRLSLEKVSHVEGCSLVDASCLHPIENMVASCFAVSGFRKVSVILSESRRKVRIFEMEVDEEEEEEEGMDTTSSIVKESDVSSANISKSSDIHDDHPTG